MSIVKSSVWSAVGTIVRVATSFVSNKLLAILTGTQGVVIASQFANFFNIIVTLSNGAINNGITRFVSEYHSDEKNLKRTISTATRFTLIFSLGLTFVLLLSANYLSHLLFKSDVYAYVIKIFACTLIIHAFYYSLLSAVTGNLNVKAIIFINCIGNVISLILISLLTYYYKTVGFLFASILTPLFSFCIAIVFAKKSAWFDLSFIRSKVDAIMVKSFFKYMVMSITTTLTMPLAQIIIRNYLIIHSGVDAAGYWQGVFKISDGYLLIIITTLNTYYLPKLSRLTENNELRTEVLTSIKFFTPIIILAGAIIVLLKKQIILILFSHAFLPMQHFFLPQIMGDVLKSISWLMVYIMHARMMTKSYLRSEVLFISFFVGLSIFFINIWGAVGVSYAYLITYFCYVVYLVFFFKKLLITGK